MVPQMLSFVLAAATIPPVCQPVIDAQIKVITTPHHTVSTESSRPTPGEAITVDGQNYVKVRGRWIHSPMSPAAQLQQEQENIKSATSLSCSRLADESVGGASASVYKVHTETPDVGIADAQIWLSKSMGLPLKIEEDLKGDTPRHLSITYDYANIKAPDVK